MTPQFCSFSLWNNTSVLVKESSAKVYLCSQLPMPLSNSELTSDELGFSVGGPASSLGCLYMWSVDDSVGPDPLNNGNEEQRMVAFDDRGLDKSARSGVSKSKKTYTWTGFVHDKIRTLILCCVLFYNVVWSPRERT